LDHFERVFAALAGEPVDRLPVALWRHHPGFDAHAHDIYASAVEWQRRYDWDLLKITPGAGYAYEPWGTAFVYPGTDQYRVDRGIRECLEDSRPVREPGDWLKINRIDPREDPVLGQHIAGTALISQEVGSSVPTLQTIMSPGYCLMNLAGRERFLAEARAGSAGLRLALEAVTETTIDLCLAFLDAGVTGLFYSTFLAARFFLTPEEYRELCMPSDLQVLEAVRSRTRLLVHHIHGSDIYFDLLTEYPVDAVNWEDRTTPPSLAEGKAMCDACVIGGIAESALLGSPDDVRSEVQSAVVATDGLRLILGTGCVTPVIVPEANIDAARTAANEARVRARA
jgi:uroporphyrinogen decarboxylase